MLDEKAYQVYVAEQKKINNEMNELFTKDLSCHDGIYSPSIYFEINRTRITLVLQEGLPGSDWAPVSEEENGWAMAQSKKNLVANYCLPFLQQSLGERRYGSVTGVGYNYISNLRRDVKENHRTNPTKLFRRVHKSPMEQNWVFRQLKVFNPEVLVCFGTFPFFWNDMKYLYKSSDLNEYPHIRKKKGKAIVQRVKNNPFKDEIKKIVNNNEKKAEKLFSCWIPCLGIKSNGIGPDLIIQTYHPSYVKRFKFKIENYLPEIIRLWKEGKLT